MGTVAEYNRLTDAIQSQYNISEKQDGGGRMRGLSSFWRKSLTLIMTVNGTLYRDTMSLVF